MMGVLGGITGVLDETTDFTAGGRWNDLLDYLRFLQSEQAMFITTAQDYKHEGQSIFSKVRSKDMNLPNEDSMQVVAYCTEQVIDGVITGEAGVKVVDCKDAEWPSIRIPVYTYKNGDIESRIIPVGDFLMSDITTIMGLVTEVQTWAQSEGLTLNPDCTGIVLKDA